MLSKHFKLNEIVDAIDECYIWWQAEVIELIYRGVGSSCSLERIWKGKIKNTNQ